jgi:hypothetical protein
MVFFCYGLEDGSMLPRWCSLSHTGAARRWMGFTTIFHDAPSYNVLCPLGRSKQSFLGLWDGSTRYPVWYL